MTDDFYNEDRMEYSLEEHLKLLSEKDPKYKSLYATWTLDEKIYTKALLAVILNFPHYSMHDSSHSWNIVNKIEMLLGESRIKQLSPTDTFLILESCFLHDFGMIIDENKQRELWQSINFKKYIDDVIHSNYDEDLVRAAKCIKDTGEKDSERDNNETDKSWAIDIKRYVVLLTADYFRSIHNKRSAEIIMDSSEISILGGHNTLIPERLMRLLAQIAIMHGTSFTDVIENLSQEDNGIGTDIIHPRMLACLLRLGDLLDLDNGRFNEVMGKVNFMPKSSQVHKQKHQAVTHFLVSPERIEVSAICPNGEVYRAARQWFDLLEEELKNLSSRWTQIMPWDFFGGPPSLGEVKLSIQSTEDRISEQLNFKFNIDQKTAFKFIEGEGIYENHIDCIREVIQNALDATKIRIWNDIRCGKYDYLDGCKGISQRLLTFSSDIPEVIRKMYPIIIKVSHQRDKGVFGITVEDNGCGIGLNDLKRIEAVGSSWKNNSESYMEIDKMRSWIKPTGSFGIGLHSLFMITDRVDIETKSEDDHSYDINFISSRENGYISVTHSRERRKVGTKIRFQFQDSLCEDKELIHLDKKVWKKIKLEEYKIDEVDEEYRQEIKENRLNCILDSFIDGIRWIEINKEIEGKQKTAGKKKEINREVSECYSGYIEEEKLQISIVQENKNLIAFVNDETNESEISFRLLDYEYSRDTNIPLLLKATGIKVEDAILGTLNIYYKNVFVESKKGELFNIDLNIVKGDAQNLLSVNRSHFKDVELLDEYKKRINGTIMPIVIHLMNARLDECSISDTNNILLRLYEHMYFNAPLKLEGSFTDREYECIRQTDTKCELQTTKASLRKLLEAQEIIITNAVHCPAYIVNVAKENKVDIILDDIHLNKFKEMKGRLEVLGLYYFEYISNWTYIARKKNESEQADKNIIRIDYNKKESVRYYLKMLDPEYYEDATNYGFRFWIRAFTYFNKNKAGYKSKINHLITKDYRILSPFIKGMEPEIFKTMSTDEVIQYLTEKGKFNALLSFVYKQQLTAKEGRREVEIQEIKEGYRELIEDYISFVLNEKE